ncbi:MAG: hypothetical protein GX630_10690 [Actinobacteria bacterium]|nr:hypothetical protein [Actinomycetota bacterium]
MNGVSVAIMAHPRRAEQVKKILVALDDVPVVVWDARGDRWDTGRRAMLAYDPDAHHHLVLQDDVVPCRDLLAGVSALLEHVPAECPVSLYLGRHRRIPVATDEAERRDACFITWRRLDHGLGIIVPTSRIEAMLKHADARGDVPNYDARLSTYWESEGIDTWYTRPSLVNHMQGPSLVPGRDARHKSPRVARWFLEEGSATAIDWSGPVVRAG